MVSAKVLAAAAALEKKQEAHNKVLEACSEKASKRVDVMFKDSKLFQPEKIDLIPKFDRAELTYGRVLGRGGFGTVNEIRGISCTHHPSPADGGKTSDDDDDDAFEDKKFIADHCLREKGGDARYAIKYISPDVKKDVNLFTQGAIDMAVETRFLSVVDHPNIIRMRAIKTGNIYDKDYFIVMDRLYDTLEQKVPKWKKELKKSKGLAGKLMDKKGKKKTELMEKRLSHAFDLAAAIEYLHSRNIIYRDLKPENIGFNVRDDIILFDFGLAKELNPEEKMADDTWKLSGDTGSLRYMAPEVSLGKPYNYTADVYSLGFLLWEMMALEKPFALYNVDMFKDRVVQQGYRPKIDENWPISLRHLMKTCWSEDIKQRPNAKKVTNILKREVAKLRGGNEEGLEHFRRRSTFVNRKALARAKKDFGS